MTDITANMPTTGSKYTNEQRIEAATQYAIKGSLSAVERLTDIPNQTLSGWKATEWWNEVIGKVREETNDKFIAISTEIIDKATKTTLEKLPEATAQQAATIGAIYYDKLRLALGQPGSISERRDGVSELMAQFRQLSETYEARNVNVVSEQEKDEAPSEG